MGVERVNIEIKELDVGEALEVFPGKGGMIGLLIEKSIERQEKQYLLTWKGSKVPRGAIVAGYEIAWTQHGVVHGTVGRVIGYYERLVECGGIEGQEQSMLVAMVLKENK